MARPQLRIYCGPQEPAASDDIGIGLHPGRVAVPLRDIFPILADAVRAERSWLRDFSEETVEISTDLYEVILAYEHYRRPSA
jgi:hypothetical protein